MGFGEKNAQGDRKYSQRNEERLQERNHHRHGRSSPCYCQCYYQL